MSDNKKVIKAGIGYTVGNYLLKGLSFITIPIFTRIMSTSDYGLYNTCVVFYISSRNFLQDNETYGVFTKIYYRKFSVCSLSLKYSFAFFVKRWCSLDTNRSFGNRSNYIYKSKIWNS